MNDKISPLFILDDSNQTIFHKDRYIIPLYQRPFAWSDKEICQLIEDINDFTTDHYYLGSLIVHLRQDGIYEVIDGQQRLTALFLLLTYLGDYRCGENRLSYECRGRSDRTLNDLAKLPNGNDSFEAYLKQSETEQIEQSLLQGRKIIGEKFREADISNEQFIANLKKVILYRIEVPPHTDLNRYFEIMNVRGEQLEQHDILKAKLMKPLSSQERNSFAVIWDACRDMTGYVQMKFSKKDRETLFGNNWNEIKIDKFNTLCEQKESSEIKENSALDIIKEASLRAPNDDKDEQGNYVRFESIIDFPHFLLHVLKVFAKNKDLPQNSLPELLDDKKLLNTFATAIGNNKKEFSSEISLAFIKCLLKCRFLFDKFIIKREYKQEGENEWSLKALEVSGTRSKKSPYYEDTYFGKRNEREKTYKPRTKVNLMLQSCLRVSYTSPKNMRWITELLSWLYEDSNRKNLSQFQVETERILQVPVQEFLKKEENFRQGVATPHVVFNYLDYLLWTKRNDKYKDFDFSQFNFEFRNSVEHWYPQHPSKETFETWNDNNRFGNLCILLRNVNSKFSNLSPTSKKDTYKQTIEKGSLKLRIMSKLTENDAAWKNNACAEHEKEMLDLLREACDRLAESHIDP